MTIEYEIGQEWQLVNGETVTIIRLEFENESDAIRRTLGSDMVWRDVTGFAIDTDTTKFDFNKLLTEAKTEVDELESDFNFRLHDQVITRILTECKSNGLFDALEFGRKVSQATTQALKSL